MESSRALRPMGMLQIVDRIFRLYRANFWLFAGIAAMVAIPLDVLINTSNLAEYLTSLLLRNLPGMPMHEVSPNVWVVGALLLVSLVASPICAGALMISVSQRYLGHPIRVGESYRQIFGRALSLLLTVFILNALWLLIIGVPVAPLAAVLLSTFLHPTGTPPVLALLLTGAIGIPLAFVLTLVLSSWLPFSMIAFVLEGKRYFAAIGRATFLLRPWYWARVLLVTIAMGFITGIIASALNMPLSFIYGFTHPMAVLEGQATWFRIVLGLINGMVGSVTMPLTTGVVILQYYDARMRKEGYDLALLAEGLAAKAPAPEGPVAQG